MEKKSFIELHGIEILTQDVEALVDFYLIALNAEREDAHGGPNRIEIVLCNRGKGANLAISHNPDASERGKREICMEFWVDDVDREHDRLIENGIRVAEGPSVLPWGFKYLTFDDPDGNHVTFVCKL